MKILLLHDVQADKQNGVSVSLGILLRELQKLNYEVKVLTLADGTKSHRDGDSYCLSSIPALIYPGIRMRIPAKSKYVDEIIDWNPDIIHTNCEFSTFMIARHIHSKCKNTPAWIHTFHTDYKYYIGFFQKISAVRDKLVPRFLNHCFKKCDALIVPTKKMYDYVSSEDFSKDINMRIIPTGIDFSELKSQDPLAGAETRKQLGISDKQRLILFLGRISAEKNLDELLEYYASYIKTHDNVHLLTVGDGPYKDSLIKKVKKLGLEEKVTVGDGVKHTDIRRFYDASDVFASASMSETQGLTFYEALFCGVPVLAKDRKCLEEAITDGENGAFFDDAESFASALDRIIDLKKNTGETAHKVLPECFQSEVFAKSVAKLYEDTLKLCKNKHKGDRSKLDRLLKHGKKLRVKK